MVLNFVRALVFFLYSGKCHKNYASTNSYDEIRFNELFLFQRTDNISYAPEMRLASEFHVVLIYMHIFVQTHCFCVTIQVLLEKYEPYSNSEI